MNGCLSCGYDVDPLVAKYGMHPVCVKRLSR